ncbi:MAG: hypothetical protein E7E64_16705 [Clostridium celatum]|nr:hypothetical protein [Clostridium celatum]
MTKTEILEKIREEFESMRDDERYSQQQKNEKYGSLMTIMEQQFNIPLLAGTEFDRLDNDVKELYLMISNARIFD